MGEQGNYRIILSAEPFEVEVKKSRFIARLKTVQSEEEALGFLSAVRSENREARHNCSAFRIGSPEKVLERASDDGEPQGTAGKPMLALLQGAGLYDCIAVVTRYFGGTLLGTGGLLRAYSDALKGALTHAVTAELKAGELLEVGMGYEIAEKVRYRASQLGVSVLEENYSEICRFRFLADDSVSGAFRKAVTDLSSGKAKVRTESAVLYYDQPEKGLYRSI